MSRATAGLGKTFSRPLWGESFQFFKWRILLYFIFLRDDGAPNVAWPGVTYSPTLFLDGPGLFKLCKIFGGEFALVRVGTLMHMSYNVSPSPWIV